MKKQTSVFENSSEQAFQSPKFSQVHTLLR